MLDVIHFIHFVTACTKIHALLIFAQQKKKKMQFSEISFQKKVVNKLLHTVEPLWKCQGCPTKVAKYGPFPCIILYKSYLLYHLWQATSFERPPFWVAFVEGFHCIHEVPSHLQCKFYHKFPINLDLFPESPWKVFIFDPSEFLGTVLLCWLVVRLCMLPASSYYDLRIIHKIEWIWNLCSFLNNQLSFRLKEYM